MSARQPARPLRRVLDLTEDNPVAVEMGTGGVLLSSPQSVAWTLHALREAVGRQLKARDGYPVPPPLLDLIATLQRRHDANLAEAQVALADADADPDANAGNGNAAMPQDGTGATWVSEDAVTVTVEEAARLLGVKARAVRYLLEGGDLPGRKRGGVWQIDLLAVTEAARERQERTA